MSSEAEVTYLDYGKHNDSNCVWYYFKRASNGKSGKCRLCSKVIKIVDHSRKGMLTHIEKLHGIDKARFRAGGRAADAKTSPTPRRMPTADRGLECTFCRRRIKCAQDDAEDVNFCFGPMVIEGSSIPDRIPQRRATLNLLNIDSATFEARYGGEEWNLMFCDQCVNRNELICKFANQILQLQKQLETIREEIERDFKKSIVTLELQAGDNITADSSKSFLQRELAKNCGIACSGILLHGPQQLLAEELALLEDPNQVADLHSHIDIKLDEYPEIRDQQQFPAVADLDVHSTTVPDFAVNEGFFVNCADQTESGECNNTVRIDSAKISNGSDSSQRQQDSADVLLSVDDFTDPLVYLKEIYDLKDCSITLSKLRPMEVQFMLDKCSSQKPLKCVFSDCSKEVFLSKEDRYQHVQNVHLKYLSATKVKAVVETFDGAAEAGEDISINGKKGKKRQKPKKGNCEQVTGEKISAAPPKVVKQKLRCPYTTCSLHGRCTFSSSKDLHAHIQKSHEGVSHPFYCKECQRKFATRWQYHSHIKAVHLGQYPYKCSYCSKGYVNKTYYEVHLSKHTNEKKYPCPVCDQWFKTPHGAIIHKRYAHTGERPYQCETCGKSFVNTTKLKNHIKCIHQKTHRPFVCHICGKDFPINGYLYMHMKNSHGAEKPQSKKLKDSEKADEQNSLEVRYNSLVVNGENEVDTTLASETSTITVALGNASLEQSSQQVINVYADNQLTVSDQQQLEGLSGETVAESGMLSLPQDFAVSNAGTTIIVVNEILKDQGPVSLSESIEAHVVGILNDGQYIHYLHQDE